MTKPTNWRQAIEYACHLLDEEIEELLARRRLLSDALHVEATLPSPEPEAHHEPLLPEPEPEPEEGPADDEFICPTCGREVSSEQGLKTHHGRMHSAPLPKEWRHMKYVPPVFKPTIQRCEWCHKQFADEDQLLEHYRLKPDHNPIPPE